MPPKPPATRHRPPLGRALGAAALAMGLVALGCSGPPPPAATPAATASRPAAGTLLGRVTLPEELVPADQVIPTGIGRVVPTGVGRYRLAAAGELPVTGARVTALDPATRAPLAGVAAATTDAAGAFALAGLAPDAAVLVAVSFRLGDRDRRMWAIARAAAEPPTTDVTWRSTLAVAEHLAEQAGGYRPPAPGALAAREAALAEQAAALSPAERLELLTRAVLAPEAPPSPAAEPSRPAPAASAPAPVGEAVQPLASPLAAVASALPAVTQAATAPLGPLPAVPTPGPSPSPPLTIPLP